MRECLGEMVNRMKQDLQAFRQLDDADSAVAARAREHIESLSNKELCDLLDAARALGWPRNSISLEGHPGKTA